jgi:hypothetical protein
MTVTSTGRHTCAPRPDARPAREGPADELHHSMESLYGLCQQGQRTALAPEARHAFRLMSRWLENALWPVAS